MHAKELTHIRLHMYVLSSVCISALLLLLLQTLIHNQLIGKWTLYYAPAVAGT